MRYCTPWQEDVEDFWTMRDSLGNVFAIVCPVYYSTRVDNPIVNDCFRQNIYLLAFIENHGTVAEAKAFIEEVIPKLNEPITILKDKRLMVMT